MLPIPEPLGNSVIDTRLVLGHSTAHSRFGFGKHIKPCTFQLPAFCSCGLQSTIPILGDFGLYKRRSLNVLLGLGEGTKVELMFNFLFFQKSPVPFSIKTLSAPLCSPSII